MLLIERANLVYIPYDGVLNRMYDVFGDNGSASQLK